MKPTSKSLIPYYTKVNLKDNEKCRTYVFPKGDTVVINEPDFLIISDNGHRVHDLNEVSHYIPYGWIHLFWKNKDGKSFLCEEKE